MKKIWRYQAIISFNNKKERERKKNIGDIGLYDITKYDHKDA